MILLTENIKRQVYAEVSQVGILPLEESVSRTYLNYNKAIVFVFALLSMATQVFQFVIIRLIWTAVTFVQCFHFISPLLGSIRLRVWTLFYAQSRPAR